MLTRSLILSASLLAVLLLQAQSNKLSLGLNVTYATYLGIGLGASLEYQHPLCPHWVAVAQAGGIKYGDVAVVDEQQSDVLLRNDWIAWTGVGLGYCAHTDGHRLPLRAPAGCELVPSRPAHGRDEE